MIDSLATQTPHKKTGFSLIEAAIVLGIIGIVIGGIWVATSAVQMNRRVNVLVSDILKIQTQTSAKGRSFFNGITYGIPTTNWQQEMGMIPADWVFDTANGLYVEPTFQLQVVPMIYDPNTGYTLVIRVQTADVSALPRPFCDKFMSSLVGSMKGNGGIRQINLGTMMTPYKFYAGTTYDYSTIATGCRSGQTQLNIFF